MPKTPSHPFRIAPRVAWGLLLLVALCRPAAAQKSDDKPPSPDAAPATVSAALGCNVHFTVARPKELDQLAATGIKCVRMDLDWSKTETAKGQYDFADYDVLVKTLLDRNIRPLLILDYGNPFYDNGQSPSSDDGRAAFTAWAVAAVSRYQGKGILWETYNEPNGGFWKPTVNVDDYIKLAVQVGKALSNQFPNEHYVGPACAGIDLRFLEACFKAGLLEYWSGVTVHPYRRIDPEGVVDDLSNVRRLIAKYAPPGKQISVIAGEWGYSGVWPGFDDARQAKYLPRQMLFNLYADVPLTVWYEWRDSGDELANFEHHFGLVNREYDQTREPVYLPKPAYVALKTLGDRLGDYTFSKRLMVDREDVIVLLFQRAGDPADVKLAVWTTSDKPQSLTLPASDGEFAAATFLGEPLPDVVATGRKLKTVVGDSVVYLSPKKPNALLTKAANWQRVPFEIQAAGPTTISVLNRSVRLNRQAGTNYVPFRGPEGYVQATRVVITNGLKLNVAPQGERMIVTIGNPSGDATTAVARLLQKASGAVSSQQSDVSMPAGQTLGSAAFGLSKARDGVVVASAELKAGNEILASVAPVTLDLQTWAYDDVVATPAGPAAGGATAALQVGEPDSGVGNMRPLQITYTKTAAGPVSWSLDPKNGVPFRPLVGEPKEYGLWIKAEGSRHTVRMRFVDSTGQVFDSYDYVTDWTGWKFVRMDLQDRGLLYSGGAADGKRHYPIRISAALVIGAPPGWTGTGTISIAGPMIVR